MSENNFFDSDQYSKFLQGLTEEEIEDSLLEITDINVLIDNIDIYLGDIDGDHINMDDFDYLMASGKDQYFVNYKITMIRNLKIQESPFNGNIIQQNKALLEILEVNNLVLSVIDKISKRYNLSKKEILSKISKPHNVVFQHELYVVLQSSSTVDLKLFNKAYKKWKVESSEIGILINRIKKMYARNGFTDVDVISNEDLIESGEHVVLIALATEDEFIPVAKYDLYRKSFILDEKEFNRSLTILREK